MLNSCEILVTSFVLPYHWLSTNAYAGNAAYPEVPYTGAGGEQALAGESSPLQPLVPEHRWLVRAGEELLPILCALSDIARSALPWGQRCEEYGSAPCSLPWGSYSSPAYCLKVARCNSSFSLPGEWWLQEYRSIHVCGFIWFEFYKMPAQNWVFCICRHLKILNELQMGQSNLTPKTGLVPTPQDPGTPFLAVMSLSWAEAILKHQKREQTMTHQPQMPRKHKAWHSEHQNVSSCFARNHASPTNFSPPKSWGIHRCWSPWVPRQAMALIRWKSNGTFLESAKNWVMVGAYYKVVPPRYRSRFITLITRTYGRYIYS